MVGLFAEAFHEDVPLPVSTSYCGLELCMSEPVVSVKETLVASLDQLEADHYYGWEFPGNTWDGVPAEVVKAGLDGLEKYIELLQWVKRGPPEVRPDGVPF